METETVALLPVLRRLEVQVGGQGAAQSPAGLRLLLEHLSLRGPATPLLAGVQVILSDSYCILHAAHHRIKIEYAYCIHF